MNIVKKVIEDEAFWQNHARLQKSSGLSRKSYCKQHNLNYDRFGYWVVKRQRQLNNATKLIAVKLKSTQHNTTQPILCTLEINNKHCLKIYDVKALVALLTEMQ